MNKEITAKVNHGTLNYFGCRCSAGDTLKMTQRFFDACPGRFTKIEEPKPKARRKKKPEIEVVEGTG